MSHRARYALLFLAGHVLIAAAAAIPVAILWLVKL